MFKRAISFFLIASLLIPPGAYARRTEMSHERFVHLTDTEKDRLIVLTMEMMAELEENYTYEVSVNGHSEELHQKYTSIMKTLYQFLISEAQASDDKKGMEWKTYAEKFRAAVDSPSKSNDKCFFAGWPSKIQDHEIEVVVKIDEKKTYSCPKGVKVGGSYPLCHKALGLKVKMTELELDTDTGAWQTAKAQYDKAQKACVDAQTAEQQCKEVVTPATTKKVMKPTGKKVCVVPSQIKDKTSAEYKAYMEHKAQMEKKGCKASEISCNPTIFGFKSAADNSVFCVPSAFGTPAENASHSCMKKALADPPEKGADSKDTRLETLRKALSGNPEYVNSIYEYMEKLCLCDNKDPGKDIGKVNEAYLKKIKPHRTCYAMMEMMGQTLTCTSPLAATSGIDLTFFEKIKLYTSSNKSGFYKQEGKGIEEHYAKYLEETGKSEQYKYLCKGEKKPGPVEETPKVKVYSCKVEEPCKEAEKKATAPAAPDTSGASAVATTGGAPAAPADASATAPATATIISCPVKVFEEGKEEALVSASVEGPAASEVEHEFKTGTGDEKSKVKCKLPEFKKEEAPKACVLKLDGEDKDIKATVSLDPKEAEKFTMEKFVWSDKKETKEPTNTFTRKPEEELTVSVTVSLKAKAGGKEASTTCSDKKPGKKDEKDPTLKLTDGAVTAKDKTAIAKAEGKLDGWKLVWFDDGDSPVAEEKKGPAVAGDSTPPADPAVPPAAPAAAKDPATPPAAPAAATDPATAPAAPPAPAPVKADDKKPAESKKFTSAPEEPSKDSNKIVRPKTTKDYKVCAKLVKDKKSVAGDKCIDIPKLAEVAPPPPPTPAPEKGGKSGGFGGMPQGGAPPAPFRGNFKYGNAGTN